MVPKWNKATGIVISILMVLLGIALFMMPMLGMLWIEYVASACIMIYGIYQIINYTQMPKDAKDGWVLANGIILGLCGLLFLFSKPGVTYTTYALLLAIISLSIGINQLCLVSLAKKEGMKVGLLIASGIINLLLGLFFCIAPFFMEWIMAYVIAIYLLFAGVALFAESCSSKVK